jgi:hypothetical protein
MLQQWERDEDGWRELPARVGQVLVLVTGSCDNDLISFDPVSGDFFTWLSILCRQTIIAHALPLFLACELHSLFQDSIKRLFQERSLASLDIYTPLTRNLLANPLKTSTPRKLALVPEGVHQTRSVVLSTR